MTSPDSTGVSRPAKAAGFALLGVAAVALVIGIVSLFSGGSSNEGNAATTTTTTTSPVTSSSAPASSSEAPSSAAPTTTTVAPPVTTTAPPQTPSVPKVPVRVYNNSTITGLAARASDDVKRAGWDVSETGNYSQGQIPTTTVYFRPGTDEEASAKALAETLRARVEVRFDGIKNAAPGVILIVTNDYKGPTNSK